MPIENIFPFVRDNPNTKYKNEGIHSNLFFLEKKVEVRKN